MELGEEERPDAGDTLPPSPAPSKAPSASPSVSPSQAPTTAATTPPPPPPPPPPSQEQQQQQRRRSRPLSRGSLESTLADLDGVAKGVDVRAVGSWEPEPQNPLRRPYWLLRLVRQSVRQGGFITPKLHVPALVWQMDRASFAGLSVKTRAFEACLILLLDRVLPLEKPRGPQDGALARQALQAFGTVRAEFDQLQNQLSRPFPFIRRTTTAAAAAAEGTAEATAGDGGGSGSGGGGGGGLNQVQQRLSSMVMSIGKTVKKSAVSAYTAYERIGACCAPPFFGETSNEPKSPTVPSHDPLPNPHKPQRRRRAQQDLGR